MFDCTLGGIMATQCEIDAYINERLDNQIEWYDKKSSSKEKDCDVSQSILVYPEGFEPPTFWFVAKHSIQLSYGYKTL